MLRHDLLRELHELYRPRTYFEIGVQRGHSLALSRVPTVAVDPAFTVNSEIHCDVQLVKATSDDFFRRDDPFAHFRGIPVDLAFIDGMHLFEFVLRDFINVERHVAETSVIVLDDVLPRGVTEAARHRRTRAWAGDVYKIVPVLQRYRSDLTTIVLDTEPTGTLIVLGADPGNTVLAEHYDEIVHDYVVGDPQQVPADMLQRRCAVDPRTVMAAPFWSTVRAARDLPGPGAFDRQQLRAVAESSLELQARPRVAGWRPDRTRRRPVVTPPSLLRALRRRVVSRLPAHWQDTLRRWADRAN